MEGAPFETNRGTVFGDMRMPIYRGLLVHRLEETDEEVVMKRLVRSGETAFDIGVFWGLYTAFLSKMVGPAGKVHSFEPNSTLHPMLKLTAENLGNVKVHPVALSDKSGEVDFFVPVHDGSMASLTNWTDDRGWEVSKITCEMRPLDEIIEAEEAPPPDFIKCDVEGAELSVFKGSARTLSRVDAPILMFEVNPKATGAFGNEPDSVMRFLSVLPAAEYKFFEVVDKQIVPVADYSGLHFNQWGFTNAVAVPAAKCHRLEE